MGQKKDCSGRMHIELPVRRALYKPEVPEEAIRENKTILDEEKRVRSFCGRIDWQRGLHH